MERVDPVIGRFYEAIGRADPDALTATLTEDFLGHVADGLPGLGGTHQGAEAMLAGAWIPAFLTYRAVPVPDETVVGHDGTTVVLGRYRGRPPTTGVDFDAGFAHLFRLRDGLICELRQITDTRRWVDAASPEGANRAVATQVFDAVRAGDLDLLLDAYSPEIRIDEDPSLPYGGTHLGRSGAVAHAAGFDATWGPFRTGGDTDPRETLLACGDQVVALWTLRAHRPGRELDVPAASAMSVSDGQVTRLRMLYADSAAISAFLTAR